MQCLLCRMPHGSGARWEAQSCRWQCFPGLLKWTRFTWQKEVICSPPASSIRDIWGKYCFCSTVGTGSVGAMWKLPRVSITHQKPALKYHYSCTSQFASTVTSKMMSGSESKSEKDVLLLTSVNERGLCKNLTWFRWQFMWNQSKIFKILAAIK